MKYRTTRELAWCGGLFDGEGCVHITKQGRLKRPSDGYHLKLTLSGVHKDTVDRFLMFAGRGHVRSHAGWGPRARRYWEWSCNSHEAKLLLKTLRPFLFTKAAEADLALEFAERARVSFPRRGRPPEITAVCEDFYLRMRAAKRYEWDADGRRLPVAV